MQRRAARIRLAAAIALGLGGPGCSCGGAAGGADAGPDGDAGPVGDAAPRVDANAPLIWIDFTATGCEPTATALAGGPEDGAGPRLDGGPGGDAAPGDGGGAGQLGCTGAAPLRLSFIPVAPAAVEVHEWSFGDGSEADRRATPEHVYDEPGSYDVALFAKGPGGTAAVSRPGFVQVVPAANGRACSRDTQCGSGACVCGGAPCDGLASGFCSAPCSGAPCGAGEACVDLAAGGPGPEPVPAWRDRLCLPSCGAGEACPPGTACRDLRSEDGGWTRACFAPGLLGEVGDACADEDGQLDGTRCASGACLAIGLRGACSAACEPGGCPAGAACATFTGGSPGPSCVARCGEEPGCDGDPWLACEAAGGAGDLAFTVDEEPAAGGYCAPRACADDDDCAPGRCSAGYCGP